MTDDMLRALARNGGVVMINYSVGFLSEEYRVASQKARDETKTCEELTKKCGSEACAILELDRMTRSAMMSGELPKVGWEKIVDHIDHAVKVVSVEHVGLGSDFDGTSVPLGMEHASKLPKITEALLDRGYSERDIRKLSAATSCA